MHHNPSLNRYRCYVVKIPGDINSSANPNEHTYLSGIDRHGDICSSGIRQPLGMSISDRAGENKGMLGRLLKLIHNGVSLQCGVTYYHTTDLDSDRETEKGTEERLKSESFLGLSTDDHCTPEPRAWFDLRATFNQLFVRDEEGCIWRLPHLRLASCICTL